MKKPIILILLCAVLFLIPPLNASPISTISTSEQKTMTILPVDGYDGTFVGGFGRIFKENNEWQFEYSGYLGGVYKNQDTYRIMYGNIYNLEQEKTGTITILTAKSHFIGQIKNNEGAGAPVTGFLIFTKDNFFIGRLMSFFGPAPHIWGKFTPN